VEAFLYGKSWQDPPSSEDFTKISKLLKVSMQKIGSLNGYIIAVRKQFTSEINSNVEKSIAVANHYRTIHRKNLVFCGELILR
jgi:hypothetical protein